MEVTDANRDGISNAGRVDLSPTVGNCYRITQFHAKGAGPFVSRFAGELRTCGIVLSGPHLFEYIERVRPTITSGEFTDGPVRVLMQSEDRLLACRLPGTVFDIGNPTGYKRCYQFLEAEGNRHF